MPKADPFRMRRFLDVLLKHGNFTRAAKDLYISQPYLTQTIQNAETELGVAIINRATSPIRLTAAGRIYYQYLTTLENEQAQFHKRLSQYTAPAKQVIRVGILSSLGYYLLPLILPDFLQVHPTVKIDLTEDISERNEQRLLHHDLDFLIGQDPQTIAAGLTVHDRGHDGYYAIIPHTSALYQPHQAYINPHSLSMDQLLQAPLVLSPQGSSIRRQVDYLLQKFHVDPHIVVESSNTLTVQKLAQRGLGVTFLPDSVTVTPDSAHYNLYPLPQDLVSLTYFIAFPAGKELTTPEKDFVTLFLTNLEASLADPSSR